MKQSVEDKTFLALLTGFSLFYLGLICFTPYLPMQDLPQHLFHSLVYSLKDSHQTWHEIYKTDVVFGPYSFFYYFTSFFYSIFKNMTLASKVYVSLSFLGFVFLAFKAKQFTAKNSAALLLLLPIFFNQSYFLGFTAYILAVPLSLYLLLEYYTALFAEEKLSGKFYFFFFLGHLVLFLSHPHPFALYIALSFCLSVFYFFKKKKSHSLFLYPVFFALGFFVWFYFRGAIPSHSRGFSSLFRWWSFESNLIYLLQFFTGMNIKRNPDFISLIFWVLACLSPLAFFFKRKQRNSVYGKIFLGVFFFFLLLYFVAPFGIYPSYTYVNTRLAPFVYISLIFFISQLEGNKITHFLTLLASFYFAGLNFNLHKNVSNEISEVEGVFSALPEGSTFLPLSFSTRSKFLDPHFFYETHSHVHFYYHVLTESGLSFALFNNPLQAVKFRNKRKIPPVPRRGKYFRWEKDTRFYSYILVRHPSRSFYKFKPYYFEEIKKSGSWHLLKRIN